MSLSPNEIQSLIVNPLKDSFGKDVDALRKEMCHRFDQVDHRFDAMEKRVAAVEPEVKEIKRWQWPAITVYGVLSLAGGGLALMIGKGVWEWAKRTL